MISSECWTDYPESTMKCTVMSLLPEEDNQSRR